MVRDLACTIAEAGRTGALTGSVNVGLYMYSFIASAGNRYADGQTPGQALAGGVADATGFSAIYGERYNRDIITGNDLGWSPTQRGLYGTLGFAQLFAPFLPGVVSSGRSALTSVKAIQNGRAMALAVSTTGTAAASAWRLRTGINAANALRLGTDAVYSVRGQGKSGAAESGGIQANKLAGDSIRNAIGAREAPFLPEQTFNTVGGVRRVDVLKLRNQTLAIESKVGRTALDARVRQELARDWWLQRQGQVGGVRWEFSRSQVTGEVGPTGPLLQKLQKLGFEVKVNP